MEIVRRERFCRYERRRLFFRVRRERPFGASGTVVGSVDVVLAKDAEIVSIRALSSEGSSSPEAILVRDPFQTLLTVDRGR